MKLAFLMLPFAGVLAGCNCDFDHCTITSMSQGGYRPVAYSQPVQRQFSNSPTQQAHVPQPNIAFACYHPRSRSQDWAGTYDQLTNTIYLCRDHIPTEAHKRFVVAHEKAHAQQHFAGKPFSEYEADAIAVNALLQKGDCEGIKAATAPVNNPAYWQGIQYAQEIYRTYCGGRS